MNLSHPHRAAEGIKIINRLDADIFTTVINYVHKNMSSPDGGGSVSAASSASDHHPQDDDDDQGLEELERMVAVERQEFLLLIKTLSYILKRASTFIMRPVKMQQELRDKLHLQEPKIDAIMKLWIKNIKPILDNTEDVFVTSVQSEMGTTTTTTGTSNELAQLGWKLKMQLSSEAQQKEKIPIAQLQLNTTAGRPINLEMNHAEVLSLYNQLEIIQGELDSLRSK